jgi:hypothetical protein
MEQQMTGNPHFAVFTLFTVHFGAAAAASRSLARDEAAGPVGAGTQLLQRTPVQPGTICDAAMRERVCGAPRTHRIQSRRIRWKQKANQPSRGR